MSALRYRSRHWPIYDARDMGNVMLSDSREEKAAAHKMMLWQID